MSLKTKLQEDLRKNLKGGNILAVSVLRLLLAAIFNKEKEKRYKLAKSSELKEEELAKESELTDEEIIEVISSEIKKRKEAILLVRRSLGEGGEKEKIENFINKEQQELEILKKYLPEQLSEEEIKKIAEEAIKKIGAKEIKDYNPPTALQGKNIYGKVMAELMPKLRGRADGSLVSKIVKEILLSIK